MRIRGRGQRPPLPMRTHYSVLMFQTKTLQEIPHTGGIRDAKKRREDDNIIGDVTEISVRIGEGGT